MKFLWISHFAIGSIFLVLFLLTGAYMLFNFPELYGAREEVRMMFRSTHIYILMSALMNFMAGNYIVSLNKRNFSKIRALASALILISPILFLCAFFYEPPDYLIDRPISFWGVVSLLVGVLIHTILNFKRKEI